MVFKSRRFGPHLYRNLLFFSSCLTLVVAGLKLDFPPNIAVLCNIGEPRYLNASRPFNLRFNFQPACIAYPTLEQVSATVLAGLKNMKVTPRSGGHSYIANGLGGGNGGLVVDLKNITNIDYDNETGIARVGTGNRLGDIALSLITAYERDVAHGSCPYVGLGGHASYGGFGYTSRMWGLTLDNIIAMDVVIANGTMLHVCEHENADLLWAMKGAGGSFGITTQMYFQTFPIPKKVTYFSYNWILNAQKSVQALVAFQYWSLHFNVPKELGIEHQMKAGPQQGTLNVTVTGSWYGAPADFENVVNPLLEYYPSDRIQIVKVGTYLDSLILQSDEKTLNTSKPNDPDSFYAKSLVVPEDYPLSFHAISNLTDVLVKNGSSDLIDWFVAFELWGGKQSAINSVPRNATSFVQRSSLFVTQFYASCLTAKVKCGDGTNYPQEGFQFLDAAVQHITHEMGSKWKWGAYTDYIDKNLTTTDNWSVRYYGENYPRLQNLKEKWDRDWVLGNFSSGIEPAT